MPVERSRKQATSIALDRAMGAAEILCREHIAKIIEFEGFFSMVDVRRSASAKGIWEAQMDAALAELLRSGGKRVIFGPYPSAAHAPSTAEHVDMVTHLKTSDMKKWHGWIETNLDSLLEDVSVGMASEARNIVGDALTELLTKEAAIFEGAAKRMGHARSGRAVSRIAEEEARQTMGVFTHIAHMCNYISYRGAAKPQLVAEIIGSGSGAGLLQRVESSMLRDRAR